MTVLDGGRARKRGRRIHGRVVVIAAALIVGAGALRISGPIGALRAQRAELARLHLEKSALALEKARLEEYKRRLASEAGREEAAREQGYVRDGERRLIFVPQRAPATQAESDPAAGNRK
jgi:cell division protein FtsB